MISKAKKDYLCHKIVNCGSSRELFRLSSQMMGKFGDTIQSEKMKRLPSHPLHSKFEAPTENRLKRQSPNHLVKALQQKHRISSSARNQPLEMLQNYEDWQAEIPTIILDIPGIQAKNHHTDEELRSLTLEALSVAYPSTTWARLTQMGQQKRQQKMAGVEFSLSSLMADPSGSL